MSELSSMSQTVVTYSLAATTVILIVLAIWCVLNWRLLWLRWRLKPWFEQEDLTHAEVRRKGDSRVSVTVCPKILASKKTAFGYVFVVKLDGKVSLRLLQEKADSLAEQLGAQRVEIRYARKRNGGERRNRAIVLVYMHDSVPEQFGLTDFKKFQ